MKIPEPIKKDITPSPTADVQKKIDGHLKTASHFEAAAKSHKDAAEHHKQNNEEKATKSAIEAKNHSNLAIAGQKTDH